MVISHFCAKGCPPLTFPQPKGFQGGAHPSLFINPKFIKVRGGHPLKTCRLMKSKEWASPKNLWVDKKWGVGTPLQSCRLVDKKWGVGTPLDWCRFQKMPNSNDSKTFFSTYPGSMSRGQWRALVSGKLHWKWRCYWKNCNWNRIRRGRMWK